MATIKCCGASYLALTIKLLFDLRDEAEGARSTQALVLDLGLLREFLAPSIVQLADEVLVWIDEIAKVLDVYERLVKGPVVLLHQVADDHRHAS